MPIYICSGLNRARPSKYHWRRKLDIRRYNSVALGDAGGKASAQNESENPATQWNYIFQ